jgi:ketosteroid isomerase-like protein
MAEIEEFRAQAALEEQNEEIMRRYFEVLDNGVNKKDLESIFVMVDEIFSDEYICHFATSKINGPKELKELLPLYPTIYGDIQHIIEDNFAKGNMVVTRCTFRAIHKGNFMGVSPTGKQMQCPIIYVHRIEDGKIKEAWIDWDSVYDIMTTQLGMELKPKEAEK